MRIARKKDKGKHLPPVLQEQWEKDRQKKAENKRKRAADRIALAADPLVSKKGGKKGKKKEPGVSFIVRILVSDQHR